MLGADIIESCENDKFWKSLDDLKPPEIHDPLEPQFPQSTSLPIKPNEDEAHAVGL